MNKNNLNYRILKYIKENGEASRIEISKVFQIAPASVTRIIDELLRKNIIFEKKDGDSSGGRKPKLLSINFKDMGKVLGIYFAPKFIQISIGTIQGKINFTTRLDFPKNIDKVFDEVENYIRPLLKDESIKIISIIMNGLVDSEKGISIFSPHYNTRNIPLKEKFEKYRKIIFVENDVRAMALTEKIFGDCKKKHNFVVLNVEDGVGGSIYLNDNLYHGYGSMSGELGHITVKRNSLEKCLCGKRGCLETEVSHRALIKKIVTQIKLNNQYSTLKKVLDEKEMLTIDDVLKAINERDMLALNIISEGIQYISYALDMIISVINPEKIILYGKIFQNSYIYNTLLKELSQVTLNEQNYEIKRSDFFEKIYELSPFSLANYMLFKFE